MVAVSTRAGVRDHPVGGYSYQLIKLQTLSAVAVAHQTHLWSWLQSALELASWELPEDAQH
eukprot:719502-Amphidinium_carterae.1